MSWFNWEKNSKTCPRCNEETMHYPCIDCGFDPVKEAKEKNLLKEISK